jgi:hypothetical protein
LKQLSSAPNSWIKNFKTRLSHDLPFFSLPRFGYKRQMSLFLNRQLLFKHQLL